MTKGQNRQGGYAVKGKQGFQRLPVGEGKTLRVTLRMAPALKTQVDERAVELGISRSVALTNAIELWLEATK